MKKTEGICFGHSGEIRLKFEGTEDIKVTIESVNPDGHHFWIAGGSMEDFTEEFEQLIKRYFI